MSTKKGQPFPFAIIAVVLGWTIFKHIDFKNLTLEKPLLDTVYILTFLMSVYFLVQNLRKD